MSARLLTAAQAFVAHFGANWEPTASIIVHMPVELFNELKAAAEEAQAPSFAEEADPVPSDPTMNTLPDADEGR